MHTHYRIRSIIKPKHKHLKADVEVTYLASRPTTGLEVTLHKDLVINTCTGDRPFTIQDNLANPCPFTIGGQTFALNFDHPLATGEVFILRLGYAGPIDVLEPWAVNGITLPLIELGLYAPWYPFLGMEPFTFDVSLVLGAEYDLVGSGRARRTSEGWQISSFAPATDIAFLAAPDFKKAKSKGDNDGITVLYTFDEEHDTAHALADKGTWLLSYFSQWFNHKAPYDINIVIPPRKSGGGYARPGLVVLSQLEDYQAKQETHFKYLAHEIAHLWWHQASVNTWEDWLNEGFAEYCALKATLAHPMISETYYDEIMAKKYLRIANTPPIKGICRQAKAAHTVLYDKGAVILLELEEKMGEEKWNLVLKQRLARNIHTTEGFLKLLEEIGGTDLAIDFALVLETR